MDHVIFFFYIYLTEANIYERRNMEESVNNEIDRLETLNSATEEEKCVQPLSEEEKNSPKLEENETNIYTSSCYDASEVAFSEIMDAVQDLSADHLRPMVTFLDFAGQSMYYAFQHIYFSPRTCYILVVDMTKKTGEDVFESGVKCCSLFESWTYEGIKQLTLKFGYSVKT